MINKKQLRKIDSKELKQEMVEKATMTIKSGLQPGALNTLSARISTKSQNANKRPNKIKTIDSHRLIFSQQGKRDLAKHKVSIRGVVDETERHHITI